MTRALPVLMLGALASYSAALLGIELATSQAYVRQFFTDIEGPVPFYAVNTTLSVFLLAGSGLMLVFTWARLRDDPAARDVRRFFLAQAAIFGMMAFDDRFMVHEKVSYRLGVLDHYVLLVTVAAELGLLAVYCRPRHFTPRTLTLFLAGAALFGVMLAVDALAPEMMTLRLSIEDLAKTWSAAMFFWFGWESARWQLE